MNPAIPVMRTFTATLCVVLRCSATGQSAGQRSNQSWSAQYIRLPFQSVLETGNSVGTLRRSLLVSSTAGGFADGADHEHVVAGEVEHLLGRLEPLVGAELG